MNGDEGGYGVSFDAGQDVRRKKGGALQAQPTPPPRAVGGIEPPPMDTGWAGGWGTDFTPDPGIPDPIASTQTPPRELHEVSPDPLQPRELHRVMEMEMQPGHQEQQMELPGVPGTEFVGGGPTTDPGRYGDNPYMPTTPGPPGFTHGQTTPGDGSNVGWDKYMGSGVMPGADEDPFAGDATEVYGGSNVGGSGNTQGAQPPQPRPLWDWTGKPAGMKDWMYANQPTQLDFNWQSGKGDWWAAPSDWGSHMDALRTTGQHPRSWAGNDWMGGTPGGIPESAYSWRAGTTPPPSTDDIAGFTEAQGRYESQFGGDPWSPTTAFGRGSNIRDYQNEYNQNVTNYNIAADQAYEQWKNRPKPPPPPPRPTPPVIIPEEPPPPPPRRPPPPEPPVVVDDFGPYVPPNTGTTTPETRTRRTNQIASPHTYDERVPGSAAAVDTGNLPGEADVNQVQSQIGGLQQMGTDPMSRLMGATAAGLMTTGGVAPTPMASEVEGALVDSIANRGTGAEFETNIGQNAADEYMRLIESGGALPFDRQQRAMEIENIRSPLDDLRQAQLAQGGAAMADRGLTGQGPEYDFRERTEKKLAPMYAQAGRDLELAQRQEENVRYRDALTGAQEMGTEQRRRGQEEYLSAMQQATGLSAAQSQNLVNTLATTGDLQENMQDFALDLLRENVGWNKFLHETGIMRDTIEELVTRNRIGDLVNILNSYTDLGGMIGTGMVDYGYKVRQEDKG